MKVSDLDAFKAHLSTHPETVKVLTTTSFTKNTEPSSSNAATPRPTLRPRPLGAIKWAVLHLHLCLLLVSVFLVLCVVYTLSEIHDEYFVTILQRAKRTDADLLQEFTYYDRECNLADISAGTQDARASLLLLDDNKNDNTTSSVSVTKAIDQMMRHGAGMLPQLLPLDTVQELRAFVVQKNAAVKGTAAEYPMSTALHRLSYGIEATEDPRVISALQQLHANPFFEQLLKTLVGPNPSLTEITAITASAGCEHQSWHPDVKPDGNAMRFGQTYSHSYSLFIPLQDTTGEMGATDLCPGTHYCGDELHDICEGAKLGLHDIMGGGVWRAGDGVLFNQQVWHRGTAHTDPTASERMVFIVSFLARPVDQRQLSRGTYFHMKWNMWGHTWQDLGDAAVSMAWPFNILRCLHLWKPKGREWGYDLFTSASMRIANNQQGCEPEDLQSFLSVLDRLGFPEWLDGTIDTDTDQAWPLYIRETIANYKWFMSWVNIGVLSTYFAFCLAWAVRTQHLFQSGGLRVIRNAVGRVLVTHGLVVALTLYSLDSIHSSEWGIGLSSGKTLMRPFPPVQQAWSRDPFVSKGLTTMPFRHDVLVGTRSDSETLGAYARWLDYHPGNRVFRDYVSTVGGQLYRSYELGLPPIFHQQLLNQVVDVIASTGGRFLEQDYRTGDWRHMTKSETQAHVRLMLTTETTHGVEANVKRQIDFLIGKYRFGMLQRTTNLSRISQSVLHQFKTRLFGTLPNTELSSKPSVSKRSTSWLSSIPSHLPTLPTMKEMHQPMVASNRRWHSFAAVVATLEEVLYVGKEIALPRGNKGTISATIIDIDENGQPTVAVYGEMATSAKIKHTVEPKWLLKHMLPMEGGRVQGELNNEWYFGTITRVRPDGALDINFDDGDVWTGLSPDRYILVPDEL